LIDRFGASAPSPLCMEKVGFTVENVVATAKGQGWGTSHPSTDSRGTFPKAWIIVQLFSQ
jgi:hypothetical protein